MPAANWEAKLLIQPHSAVAPVYDLTLQTSRIQRVSDFRGSLPPMSLSYPSQPQEVPQIEIVVPGSDDGVGTPSPSTMSSPSLRRMASSDQTRPETPLGLSTSCASSSRFYPASLVEGTTPRSGSSTQVASSTNLQGAKFGSVPILASEVKRNDRKRVIPRPTQEVHIEPGGMNVFDHPPTVDEWVPNVHPDGALYFFDPTRRIYTDANLLDEKERSEINNYAEQLLQKAREMDQPEFPWTTCELVLELIDEGGCGYYFIEPGKRRIFWLDRVPIGKLTKLRRVGSLAHIKYVMEAEYWIHCMHFPNKWSVTQDVVLELEQMVIHAVADCVPSTTSVIPFDQDELQRIFDLTDRLKGATKEDFPHARCVVARFMLDFANAKFFNFCGQPGARLNSDQSIFSKSKPKRSMLIRSLSFLLWGAPCDYAKELDGIWVDKIINRVMWKQFIAKLSNDWSGLALYATVILNANVAFLALGGNTAAKSFSFISTITSVGVVVIGLMLVRQSQRKDQDSVEQAELFLKDVANPVFGMEQLAIIFSLPYALLMWSMVWFIVAFACMVFPSAQHVTRSTFGIAGGFVGLFIVWTGWITRFKEESKVPAGSIG